MTPDIKWVLSDQRGMKWIQTCLMLWVPQTKCPLMPGYTRGDSWHFQNQHPYLYVYIYIEFLSRFLFTNSYCAPSTLVCFSPCVLQVKRTNLKKPSSERTGHGLRVKFNPLALLLDASLEGEFDLVQRIIYEVTSDYTVVTGSILWVISCYLLTCKWIKFIHKTI